MSCNSLSSKRKILFKVNKIGHRTLRFRGLTVNFDLNQR